MKRENLVETEVVYVDRMASARFLAQVLTVGLSMFIGHGIATMPQGPGKTYGMLMLGMFLLPFCLVALGLDLGSARRQIVLGTQRYSLPRWPLRSVSQAVLAVNEERGTNRGTEAK